MQLTQKIEYLEAVQTPPSPLGGPKIPPFIQLFRLGFRLFGVLAPKQTASLAVRLFSTPRIRAKHKVSDVIMEKARIFEFLYAGKTLKAYEWGSGEQVVLLVHGWESRGTALRSFVPGLLEKGFKVVAFDGPAHGNSSGKRTDLRHFGGAIRAIINHVGGVHSIIAHSFGGSSTLFTLTHIDRGITVDKLVLIASPADVTYVLKDFFQFICLPTKARYYFKRKMEKRLGQPLEAANFKDSRHPEVKIGELLVIHDQEDAIVPMESSKLLIENWDNARGVISKGWGHYKLMKQPEILQRVGAFIAA